MWCATSPWSRSSGPCDPRRAESGVRDPTTVAVGSAGVGEVDATSERFAHLLAPAVIGPMAVANRIVLSPMGDRLADDDGTVSERQASYLEARARGGAGLVVIGSVSVSYPEGSYASCQTALSHDRFIDGLAGLAERVHRHGARLAAQLVHDGASSLLDVANGRDVLVPSKPPRLRPDALSAMVTAAELEAMTRPFTTPTSRFGYRVATDDDIAGVIGAFAEAAGRAAAAGLDGVEIHAGHGYLIDSFLSPVRNTRSDGWGGSVPHRAGLLVEVLRAVRARVGDRLAVWVRLNGEERHVEGGETLEDALLVAQLAVEAGADAIHVSAYADPGVAVGVTDAHTPQVPGLNLPLAARMKQAVDVPVIAVGRIEPDVADQAIATGQADLVAMGRALLADPDLPAKLATGRVDDVRPCIYQYRCIGNIFLNEPVACVVNPALGRGDEAWLPPTTSRRRVLVVGGGPAGMAAAVDLAERGHAVTLAEQSPLLGGALVAAAATDETLDRLLGWLRHRVAEAPVDVQLGVRADRPLAGELAVDVVVVATGGRWAPLDEGSPAAVASGAAARAATLGEVVASGWFAVDDGPAGLIGPRVVVVGGGKAALSFAALAAQRDRQVAVVEPSGVFAPELGPPGRFRLVHDVASLGVELRPGWSLDTLGGDGVRLVGADGSGGVAVAELEADVVVSARCDAVADAGAPFTDLGAEVFVLGDAGDDRRLEGALGGARSLALALG